MSGFAAGPFSDLLASVDIGTRLQPWSPFPTIDDRQAWEAVSDRLDQTALAAATATAWPELPASLWQDYARTGNRERHESRFFERREQLNAHICLAGANGEVSDALLDRLWSLLEESAWWVPCHDYLARHPQALPNSQDPVLDLFAAQTGAQLALARHVLAPALERIAPVINARLATEIDRRIVTPYLVRDDWWWLGKVAHTINNWNPWINLNTLLAALLVVDDSSRRSAVVERVVHSLDAYLADMPTDGGCTEGQSYWAVAASKVIDACVILKQATGGALDATTLPQVVASARYPVAMHIGERWMVQHADGNGRCDQNPQLLHRYGSAVDDEALQQFALSLRDLPDQGSDGGGLGNLWDQLSGLFDDQFHSHPTGVLAPYPAVSWFATTQVLTARAEPGTTRGLFLAVKGGHNDEDHNHNDVGSFSIALDGHPVVIDPGVNTYTAQTFSPQRYDLWTMQSRWHNLPTINDHDQQAGAEHRATDVAVTGADDPRAGQVTFEADLNRAWGPAAGVRSWHRRVVLDRATDTVQLTDQWALDSATTLELGLVCSHAPQTNGDRSRIGGLTVSHPGLQGTVEIQPIPAGDRIESTWGSQVWRLVLRPDTCTDQGSWDLTFARA